MWATFKDILDWVVTLPPNTKFALTGLIIIVAILLLTLLWSPRRVSNGADTYLTVFESKPGVDAFAVNGNPKHVYKGKWPDAQPEGPLGEGSWSFDPEGILSVERSNTEGRYELIFQQYSYGGQTQSALPTNKSATGVRGINITCNAKAVGG